MGRKRGNKNSKGSPGSRVEVVSGRSNFNYGASTSNVLAITPATFSRAAAIADVFQFYRFTKLRVITIPSDNSVVSGYAPGAAFDTPPTTFASVIELPVAKYHGAAKFYETIMDVSRAELLRDAQLPWFKTIAGTPAVQFETQGNLYIITGAGATGGIIVVEWTCEFQSWNLAGQSPFPKVPGTLVKDPTTPDASKGMSDCLVVAGVTYRKSSA